jgi:hypothetical protein
MIAFAVRLRVEPLPGSLHAAMIPNALAIRLVGAWRRGRVVNTSTLGPAAPA